MNIKEITSTVIKFSINRLIEILGTSVTIIGLLLLAALTFYSPSDPNFIFPENTEINNILGFQGSYTSDLFFQSIGIISYLVSITLLFTGINIFINKDPFLIIENIFLLFFTASLDHYSLIIFIKTHLNYLLMETEVLLDST